ncbi:MAG: lysophospholipid acyltransferase family protein [Pirellulales bacterium]
MSEVAISTKTARIQQAPKGPLARAWYVLCRIFCWTVCKLLFRFEYSGGENVPSTGPLLVVSNHQSHLDPVLLGIASPRQVGALARASLFVWPFSWLIRSFGAVPVERGSATAGIRAILGMLKAGEPMIIFPEGTRTTDGRLQPLQTGFCAIARRSGAAIVPVTIDGAFAAFPRGKVLPRPRKIWLTFHPALDAEAIARLTDDELVAHVAAEIDPQKASACTSAC